MGATRWHRSWLNVLGCALTAGAQVAFAQAPVISTVRIGPSSEDIASAPEDTDILFGAAVAISGDVAAVGMPAHNDIGRVGIYTLSNGAWQRTATLLPSDPNDMHFGSSVVLDGHTLIVGAQGSVYVFDKARTQWNESARITSHVPMRSLVPPVEYDHGTIAVHAFGLTPEGEFLPGAVFLYERDRKNHWRQTGEVHARDGTQFDNFGSAIALERDTLVIGAPDARSEEPGAAYVFVRRDHRWRERQKLAGSDAGPSARFGASVALRGGVIIVGAPNANLPGDTGSLEGNAYVFLSHGHTWFESQRLNGNSEDTTFVSAFGTSIAMGRGLVAVSAPVEQATFRAEGNIYVFDWIGRHLTFGPQAHHDDQATGVDMEFSKRRLIAGVLGFGEPLFPRRIGHAVILQFASDPGAEQLAPEPQHSEDAENAEESEGPTPLQ